MAEIINPMVPLPDAPGGTLVSSLAHFLCRRLDIFQVERKSFPLGYSVPEAVVPSDRLILLLRGSLCYRVEERESLIHSKRLLYVPAWVQRKWVAADGGECEMFWVEFSASPPGAVRGDLHSPLVGSRREQAGFLRLMHLWQERGKSEFHPLLMEVELKAMLAQCFAQCGEEGRSPETFTRQRTSAELEVAKVVDYLRKHFHVPNVLNTGLADVETSANHFRRLFRQHTGMTLNGFLTELRMRQARYYLRETSLPVKKIAYQIGYLDPLWFSKLYRGFWKRSPLAERADASKSE